MSFDGESDDHISVVWNLDMGDEEKAMPFLLSSRGSKIPCINLIYAI